LELALGLDSEGFIVDAKESFPWKTT